MMWVLAVLVSAVALGLAARHDPKRLRFRHQLHRAGLIEPVAIAPWPAARRRGLAVLAIAPGIVLAALGLWAGVMLWLGLTLTFAWLLVESIS